MSISPIQTKDFWITEEAMLAIILKRINLDSGRGEQHHPAGGGVIRPIILGRIVREWLDLNQQSIPSRVSALADASTPTAVPCFLCVAAATVDSATVATPAGD